MFVCELVYINVFVYVCISLYLCVHSISFKSLQHKICVTTQQRAHEWIAKIFSLLYAALQVFSFYPFRIKAKYMLEWKYSSNIWLMIYCHTGNVTFLVYGNYNQSGNGTTCIILYSCISLWWKNVVNVIRVSSVQK